MPRSNRVAFATSNRGKFEEARLILGPLGIEVEQSDAKRVEIQADAVSEVATFSARSAAQALGRPVLVEDAGLFIEALHGFPGPYSAYVFKTLGVVGVLELLPRSTSFRSATFASAVAYCDPFGEPLLFEGFVKGKISNGPTGQGGFGFDPIFIPVGSEKTFGELTLEEKCAVSHRAASLKKFASWFLSKSQ